MRSNLPVTGKAYNFPSDQTLISVTDLKGRITYCNNNFVRVSGFTREELMGQPHNMVRHPDMPEEAFRDMWDTIQGGRPWSGMVKNRRKNGDHYWVFANATPVRSGESTVGYLSVRTCPTADQIEGAERLYARMRDEAASGRQVHVLRAGRLLVKTPLGRLRELLNLRPSVKLSLVIFGTAGAPSIASELGAQPWLVVLVALLGASAATWLAWSFFIRPLRGVLEAANRLAAGDLTKSVTVDEGGIVGELQLALAQLQVGVRTVVRDVRHEVANLRGGTQEISSGNMDLSSRTESQASSLEQTAASMEEITGTIKQTAHVADQGVALASEAAELSRRSHEAVQAVADTMRDIAVSSGKIGNIIQVIDGVAFQTNILALNAAVEAARAGDQGRGFAVVASEVRALAQRTTAAAREIKQLIEESIERVDNGERQTGHAQKRMDEAMAAVEKASSLIDEIRRATVEQGSGAAQISEAVTQLDTLTQQNAAMVEELAASAKALDSQVSMVHNTIRVFKLTEKDKTLAEDDAVALRKQSQSSANFDSEVGIDFDRVFAAHQQWRVTLRNAVLRQLEVDAATLRRDDCCELGKWLHGPGGKRWGQFPCFVDLMTDHREFHTTAGRVADQIMQKQYAQAERMLEPGTPFVDAGKRVAASLKRLRAQVESGGTLSRDGDAPRAASKAQAPRVSAPAPRAPVASAGGKAATSDEGDWETF